MRIAIFGATGMAGSSIVTEALIREHEVIACSRSPRLQDRERLSERAVDVTDMAAVEEVLAEVDAVVLSIRLPDREAFRLAAITRDLLDLAAANSTRVAIVGGAAPLRSPSMPDRLVIDDPMWVPPEWRPVAEASLEQFRVCRQHRFEGWTYVSPSAILKPGEPTGHFVRGTTTLLTDATGQSKVNSGDLAVALVSELENPGADRHFTVVTAG